MERGGILGAMEKYNVDLFVVPSDWRIANDLAAKMGFPVISVPFGYFPVGTPIEYENGLIIRAPGMPQVYPAYWLSFKTIIY